MAGLSLGTWLSADHGAAGMLAGLVIATLAFSAWMLPLLLVRALRVAPAS